MWSRLTRYRPGVLLVGVLLIVVVLAQMPGVSQLPGLIAWPRDQWLQGPHEYVAANAPDLAVSIKPEDVVKRLELENAARANLITAVNDTVQALVELGALFGLGVGVATARAATRNARAALENVKVAQDGRYTDRFTKAVEQLGSDKIEVRLGGIYALERLAKNSPDDQPTVVELLCAYVREHASWHVDAAEQPVVDAAGSRPAAVGLPASARARQPSTDIQAALTVLSRRPPHPAEQRIDLRRTDLRGADFQKAHLERARFEQACLSQAHLEAACLDGADFSKAQLEGAFLMQAHMTGSSFRQANLDAADLTAADLERANLSGASLRRATLHAANLSAASLSDAVMEQADLSGSRNLTPEQIAEIGPCDRNTRFPPHFLPARSHVD